MSARAVLRPGAHSVLVEALGQVETVEHQLGGAGHHGQVGSCGQGQGEVVPLHEGDPVVQAQVPNHAPRESVKNSVTSAGTSTIVRQAISRRPRVV